MLTALLIIARAVQIGASILLAGTFTFQLVALGPAAQSGSDNFREVERRLFHLGRWTLVVVLLSALFWFWLEVANMDGLPLTRLFRDSVADGFVRNELRSRMAASAWPDCSGACARRLTAGAKRRATASTYCGSRVPERCSSRLARLDQPRRGRPNATARFVGQCAPSLRGGRVDRRIAAAGNFPNARSRVALIRRMRRSGAQALFYTQSELCERPCHGRCFQ